VLIEIWSDVVCPWCFIGKRRFEEALARFEHRDQVEVVFRSFELDPNATSSADLVGHLAAKYGTTREEAEQMMARVSEAGSGVGIEFRFDLATRGNTFDAHRLLHLARVEGRQLELKERLMNAYFCEGADIADPEVLHAAAVDVGLNATSVAALLGGDAYATSVREDEAAARELGVRGVPFFVIDRAFGLSGAQAPDQILSVLEEAWAARVS
jgi:predicted DsbA family dithiol-disulfide isomerase